MTEGAPVVAPPEEVLLRIDGKEVRAKKGMTLLEAAKEAGVSIPYLCHHPSLSPLGVCRLCVVEITDREGRKRTVASCTQKVEEGLVVETRSGRLERARRAILELLLSRAPRSERILELARQQGVEPRLREEGGSTCILCGLCARACAEVVEISAITLTGEGVYRRVSTPGDTFSEVCVGCGVCARFCPTGAIREERNVYPTLEEEERKVEEKFLRGEKRDELLGRYQEILAGKGSIEGQDGGMVTAVLLSGLKRGLFEGAVVVEREEGYRARAVLADTEEGIMRARGTKYLRVKTLPRLQEAVEKGMKRIAIVGTPCQLRAIRKIQSIWEKERPDVKLYVVGLFCFESFIYEKLKEETQKLMGLDLDKAERTQISKGKYLVRVEGKEQSCPVKKLGEAVEKGCHFCEDFAARLADLSVGSVGSPDGYSTLILRSEAGRELLQGVEFQRVEANAEEILKVAKLKRDNARKSLAPFLGIQDKPAPA